MIVLIGAMVYVDDVYVGGVYELEKGLKPICASETWWKYVYLGNYIFSC